jgi:DNA modification methylase
MVASVKTQLDKENIISYITDNGHVTGLTHNFYNYPARFSPQFTRSIITEFSNQGEVILDPFMGGGTTIIEAMSTGRIAIGVDINELAYFITKVKTTLITENEKINFINQSNHIILTANIRKDLQDINYDPNFDSVDHLDTFYTWRLKKYIARLKEASKRLNPTNRNLFKCALLKVSQWAFDNSDSTPSLGQFREKLYMTIKEFAESLEIFKSSLTRYDSNIQNPILLNRSIIGIEREKKIKSMWPPKLVITSPPYPGVHILYHRWQIKGRKETSAPYWIADLQDGHGESFYTFGNRQQSELKDYYTTQYKAFRSIKKILDRDSLVVQLIAFPFPEWQLPKYLETMEMLGFQEFDPFSNNPSDPNRIWRDVPNRKWYAQKNGPTGSSKEVVLFHKLC